ncbi:heparin lyase I family protein [Vibrio scophthalmi]|uniref:polysaccharide lyase n=1 Tax=Vibrio scophthalmi TaxID=45658 RepID=UPI002FF43BF1
MKLLLPIIIALLLVACAEQSVAHLSCPDIKSDDTAHQWHSPFDDLQGWGSHFGYPHSAMIVQDPMDSSNNVLRLELRDGDQFHTRSGYAYRAEVYERYKAPFNRPIHYRFKVLITDQWQYDDVRALIAQWHATPDRHLNEISRSPNLGIELRNDRFLIRSQTSQLAVNTDNKHGMTRTQHYLSAPIEKNRWYQFDVRVKWTPNSDGYLAITINDQSVVNHRGPTSYVDCLGPYFKAGIYRDHSPNTFALLLDDYSRTLIEESNTELE